MDATNRQNALNQSVIHAKECATDAINKKAGIRVTDTILRTAKGTDYKSVDKYELHTLVTIILKGDSHLKVDVP